MPAAVWRLRSLDIGDAPELRISRADFFDLAGSALGVLSVTSSVPPSSGALLSMLDGSSETSCAWPASEIRQPGFYIEWTLIEAGDVAKVSLYTETDILRATLAGSDVLSVVKRDGAVVKVVKSLRKHSGALDFSPSIFVGLPGFVDEAGGRSVTRTGGVEVSANLTVDKVQAWQPNGTGRVRVQGVSGLDAGAFTVVLDFAYTTTLNLVIAEHGSNNIGWAIQSTQASQWSFYGGLPPGCLLMAVGPDGNTKGLWFTSVAVNDGLPHRLVAVVQANGAVCLFIDGVDVTLKHPASTPQVPVYNQTYIDLGSRNGAVGMPNPGVIGNFCLISRAITDQEVGVLSGATSALPLRFGDTKTYRAFEVAHSQPQGHMALAVSKPAGLDVEFGGYGCIYGTVELYAQSGNIPLPRRVRLHRSRDGLLVRETWSDAQGNYRFDHISDRYKYDVIAWDHEGLQQSVVANDLTPEPML